MQTDVNRPASAVGRTGALIQRQGVVPVAQQSHCEALPLEFMPEQAGESKSDGLLSQCVCQSGTTLRSAVSGIYYDKNASRRACGRRRHAAGILILIFSLSWRPTGTRWTFGNGCGA